MADADLAAMLGRVPSGLFILTVRHGEQESGMLSSWVMQAGFAPPMLTVAIGRERYIAEWLTAGAPFVLNMLPEKERALLRYFSRGFEPGKPAFEGLEIRRSDRGVPILTGTLGHLECDVRGHVDSGDHRIFLAEIVGGHVTESDHKPMVHVRKSGLHY